MGGEDFSNYARTAEKIPSVLFWVGGVAPDKYAEAKASGESLPSLHSSTFAPDYERAIPTGIDLAASESVTFFSASGFCHADPPGIINIDDADARPGVVISTMVGISDPGDTA